MLNRCGYSRTLVGCLLHPSLALEDQLSQVSIRVFYSHRRELADLADLLSCARHKVRTGQNWRLCHRSPLLHDLCILSIRFYAHRASRSLRPLALRESGLTPTRYISRTIFVWQQAAARAAPKQNSSSLVRYDGGTGFPLPAQPHRVHAHHPSRAL